MLFLKYLLLTSGIAMISAALAIFSYDLYLQFEYRRSLIGVEGRPVPPLPYLRWRGALALALLAWGPILLALAIVVVPSGMAGVRISQTSGTLAGNALSRRALRHAARRERRAFRYSRPALHHGQHEGTKTGPMRPKSEPLNVQAKEGLTVGLAITVRYRLDPKRLDYIQSNLPQPVEKELVPPIVASAWRELAPNYTVRDVFAAKREEVRTAGRRR